MSLTAEDIQTKQFHVRFRGFDVEEVDAFLERIAENFVLLQDEKRLLKEQVEKLEMTIKDFHSQERTFQHAIISAQKIADEMQEKNRRECQERLAAVQDEVERLRSASKKEQQSLERQIKELKESREKIKSELKAYLQTFLDRLDQDLLGEENAPLSLLQSDIAESGTDSSPSAEKQEAIMDEEEDLDSLYEKIELPDEEEEAAQDNSDTRKEMAAALRESGSGLDEEEEKKNPTIPDLDGDMLFALDDPLDDDKEPRLSMDDDQEDEDHVGSVRVK